MKLGNNLDAASNKVTNLAAPTASGDAKILRELTPRGEAQ